MIVVLVEGSGDEKGLPVLLRRANIIGDFHCIDMHGKSNIVRQEGGFEKTLARQSELGFSDFVVLVDRDHTFAPYSSLHEEESGMQLRATKLAAALHGRVRVFWANRAYESWLIGGLRKGDSYCGLRRITKPVPGDTQAAPSEPKDWIKDHMLKRRYNESIQVCLTKHVDWTQARSRNKSLRDFLDNI